MLLLALLGLMGAAYNDVTLLKAHMKENNVRRCQHGMSMMQWDPELALGCKKHARKQHPDIEHDLPWLEKLGVGENLYNQFGEDGKYTMKTVKLSSNAWYNEIEEWENSNWRPASNALYSNAGKQVGHFTAMLWKDNCEVGCGEHTEDDTVVICCRYRPCPGGVPPNYSPHFSDQLPTTPDPAKSFAACEAEVANHSFNDIILLHDDGKDEYDSWFGSGTILLILICSLVFVIVGGVLYLHFAKKKSVVAFLKQTNKKYAERRKKTTSRDSGSSRGKGGGTPYENYDTESTDSAECDVDSKGHKGTKSPHGKGSHFDDDSPQGKGMAPGKNKGKGMIPDDCSPFMTAPGTGKGLSPGKGKGMVPDDCSPFMVAPGTGKGLSPGKGKGMIPDDCSPFMMAPGTGKGLSPGKGKGMYQDDSSPSSKGTKGMSPKGMSPGKGKGISPDACSPLMMSFGKGKGKLPSKGGGKYGPKGLLTQE